MPVSARARNVFDRIAENDNVPVSRRRVAHVATGLTILATAVALVLVHSVPAWFPPRGLSISDILGRHRALTRIAALASLGETVSAPGRP